MSLQQGPWAGLPRKSCRARFHWTGAQVWEGKWEDIGWREVLGPDRSGSL